MNLAGRSAICLVFTFIFTQHLLAETYTLKKSNSPLIDRTSLMKEHSDKNWSLRLQVDQFKTQSFKEFPLKGEFKTLDFNGLKLSQEVGAPALPYKSFIVRGKKSELDFKMKRSGEHRFSNIQASPAPLKPCRCAKDKLSSYSFKKNTYQQTAKDLYEVTFLGDYRGVPISKVTLRPAVQSQSGLVVYEDIELVVQSKKSLSPPPITAQNDKFLMITPKKLISSAKKFAQYKESQGFNILFFVYEDVATGSKDLKSFIHNLYSKEKYQYALLFGHENILPTNTVETSSNLQTPSDFPYFAMGGQQDILPDVFYGRITADSNNEVLGQLEKLREYNDRTWSNQAGVYRSLGIASNEGWQPTDVEYMRSMLSPLERDLEMTPDYFFQDDSRSVPQNINSSLNQGVRWMNYIGHGSGDSWSSVYGVEYQSRHVSKLKSSVVKPVIIDVACQNGRFNNAGKLGETFMNARNKGKPVGAVAYYGGSVDISWDPPAVMATKISEELSLQTADSLFSLIMKGQFLLLQEYSDPEAAKENLLWYHLLGDPSLSVTYP